MIRVSSEYKLTKARHEIEEEPAKRRGYEAEPETAEADRSEQFEIGPFL